MALFPAWIYGAEITPLAIRSRANSMGIATQVSVRHLHLGLD